MKLKDIANQYGFDQYSFEVFIYQHCKLPLRLTGFSKNNLDDGDIDAAVEAYREYLKKQEELETKKKSAAERVQRKQEELKNAAGNLIMTTCPQVDGYRAVEQLGLVFGEFHFRHMFSKELMFTIDTVAGALALSDNETDEPSRMLAAARKLAMGKMAKEAVSRGANAIIGINVESTYGQDITHTMTYGTAVRLEAIE